ncbi:hypothetical protein QOZ80_2BG0155380 [Eleusine coracana subsp. coracana]|nr:hypothetical protein QOZ80_2BG0155380 [Eleusine coracana subsp. coracana]
MIALLDEHCARANRVASDVVSAYDVAYLPIDFRRQGNFGYAFVNFTTPNAGLLLYYALQGCGWKVCGSRKHIDIVPAKIQGKEELVRHFSRHKFECESKEFLPAVFTPARDGGARATSTTTTRVGKLLPAPAPRNAKKAYVVRSKVEG